MDGGEEQRQADPSSSMVSLPRQMLKDHDQEKILFQKITCWEIKEDIQSWLLVCSCIYMYMNTLVKHNNKYI